MNGNKNKNKYKTYAPRVEDVYEGGQLSERLVRDDKGRIVEKETLDANGDVQEKTCYTHGPLHGRLLAAQKYNPLSGSKALIFYQYEDEAPHFITRKTHFNTMDKNTVTTHYRYQEIDGKRHIKEKEIHLPHAVLVNSYKLSEDKSTTYKAEQTHHQKGDRCICSRKTFDEQGNEINKIGYNPNTGQKTQYWEYEGDTMLRVKYDEHGKIVRGRKYQKDSSGNYKLIQEMELDSYGHPITETNYKHYDDGSVGHKMIYDPDGADRIEMTYRYDSKFRLLGHETIKKWHNGARKFTKEYNPIDKRRLRDKEYRIVEQEGNTVDILERETDFTQAVPVTRYFNEKGEVTQSSFTDSKGYAVDNYYSYKNGALFLISQRASRSGCFVEAAYKDAFMKEGRVIASVRFIEQGEVTEAPELVKRHYAETLDDMLRQGGIVIGCRPDEAKAHIAAYQTTHATP